MHPVIISIQNKEFKANVLNMTTINPIILNIYILFILPREPCANWEGLELTFNMWNIVNSNSQPVTTV